MTDSNKASELNNILTSFRFDNNDSLIDKLTGSEIYQLVIEIVAKTTKTNQEKVTEFNDTFRAKKETTDIVEDFKFSKLRTSLIMEECLELAFAYGLDRGEVYEMFIKHHSQIYSQSPYINNRERLSEIFDAGLDLLVVVYGLFDITNMAEAVEDGISEVHKSNMSKLCLNKEELIQTVQKYREQDVEVVSEETPKGFIVKNNITGKILKSISYKKPNLKQILTKFKIIK